MLRRTVKPPKVNTGSNRPPAIPTDKPLSRPGPTIHYDTNGGKHNNIIGKTNGNESTQNQGTEIGKLAGLVVGIVAFVIIIIAIVSLNLKQDLKTKQFLPLFCFDRKKAKSCRNQKILPFGFGVNDRHDCFAIFMMTYFGSQCENKPSKD